VSATVDYLVKQAAIILNASTGSGSGDASTIGAIDDPKKYPYTFLSNFALDADAEVCSLACTVDGYALLKDFVAASGALADEATITPASGGGHVYQILNVKVDGVDARRKPTSYIKRLQSDVLSRTSIPKYYNIEGAQIIRHNGTSAICKVVRFAKGAAPQAPDPLNNATVSCLLSMATPKMDIWVHMASYFAQQWAQRAQMIRSGEITIPPVVAYQEMEKGAA
jgi:hypothetical protein